MSGVLKTELTSFVYQLQPKVLKVGKVRYNVPIVNTSNVQRNRHGVNVSRHIVHLPGYRYVVHK